MRNLQKRILLTVFPSLGESIASRFGARSTFLGETAAQALLSMSVVDNHLHPNETNDSLQLLRLLADLQVLSEPGYERSATVFRSRLSQNVNQLDLLEWAKEIPVVLWKYHAAEMQNATARVTPHEHLLNQITFTLSGLSMVSYACLYALVSDLKVDRAELALLNEIVRIFEKPERLFEYITVSSINPATRNVLYTELHRHVVAFIDASLIPLRLMRLITHLALEKTTTPSESKERWAIIVNEVTEIDCHIITDKRFFAPTVALTHEPSTQPTHVPKTETPLDTSQLLPQYDLTIDSIADLTRIIENDDERVERAVELHMLAEAEHGTIRVTAEGADTAVDDSPRIQPRWEPIVGQLCDIPNLTFEHIETHIANNIADPNERGEAYQYIMARLIGLGTAIYDETQAPGEPRSLTLDEVSQLVADVSKRFTKSLFAEYSMENQRVYLFHQLLSASEERDLTHARFVVREYANKTTSESERQTCAELENQIRETLINHNYRLVMRTAVMVHYGQNIRHLDTMDLFQEGCIGLIKAIDKFDGARGHKISTYATWWIRQAIGRAVDEQERGIRLPVHFLELIRRYKRELHHYETTVGGTPSPEDMAALLGVSEKHITLIQYWDRRIASLDQPVGDDDASLGELIPDDDTLEDAAYRNLLAVAIQKYLQKLSEREQIIIQLRYGLDDVGVHTLEEIGVKVGLTRERVRQIEVIALKKLRPMMWDYRESA